MDLRNLGTLHQGTTASPPKGNSPTAGPQPGTAAAVEQRGGSSPATSSGFGTATRPGATAGPGTATGPSAATGPGGTTGFSATTRFGAATGFSAATGPGATTGPGVNIGLGVGVEAYVQTLNALAGNQLHEQAARVLLSDLRSATDALRSAFDQVMSRLPPELALKDWGFSVADGNVTFLQHADALLAHELTTLSSAFSGSNADAAARRLAALIISVAQMKNTGADSGSLAAIRLDVDERNFGDSVDLRAYLTGTAPSSRYHPGMAPGLGDHAPVPPLLGGMDLRSLVTTRPKFLREDGSISPEALAELEISHETPEAGTVHGRCSCGQVRFIVQDEFEYAFYCHCSRCRARTGSVFAAIAGISVDKMDVIAGHEHLLLEGECSDGYGARCARCFAFLFAAVRGRKYLHVSLGVLVDSPTRLPDHHIFVGSKAPWYEITDALPQYPELPVKEPPNELT